MFGGDESAADAILDDDASSGNQKNNKQKVFINATGLSKFQSSRRARGEEVTGIRDSDCLLSLEETRGIIHRSARTIYEHLLDAGLISPLAWLVLDDALVAAGNGRLFSWDEVERAVPRVLKCIPRYRKVVIAYSAWGFLICHQRLRTSVMRHVFEFEDATFLQDKSVPKNFEWLIEESERCCMRPAEILNEMLEHDPGTILEIKVNQGLNEITDDTLNLLYSLLRKGILDEIRFNLLKDEVASICTKIQQNKTKFVLIAPQNVGVGGVNLVTNPNFSPLGDQAERDHMDEREHDTSFEKLLKSVKPSSQTISDIEKKNQGTISILRVTPPRNRTRSVSRSHPDHVEQGDELCMVRRAKPHRVNRLLDELELLATKRMRADEE
jgi:hypothetical protein